MISVVICTYNRSKSLEVTLRSLAEMQVPSDLQWELIVVDNNSTDQTRDVVRRFARDVPIATRYVFEANQGLCHARNAGITHSRGDIIAYTDDDVTVDRVWLVAIRDAFERSDCDGVGGRVVPVWNSRRPRWLQSEGPYRLMSVIVQFEHGDEPRECDDQSPPIGANMAFRRSVFASYGTFDPKLDRVGSQLISGGDTAFGRRLMNSGRRLIYAPAAVVFHPVEERRTKREYFLSWYFGYGRSEVRMAGIPADTICYWGVPRFLLRALIESGFSWFTSIRPARRFFHRLLSYRIAGQIAEAFASREHAR